jgi:hypothetical protein
VVGWEHRGRPGPPGGPPAGGPDGRVEALLGERTLKDRERDRRPAVVVGRRHLPGRPAEQPGLDVRCQQERDLPGARRPAGRAASGLELAGEPGGQLGQAAGVERGWGHDVMWAHGHPLGGSVRLAGPVPRCSPRRAGSRWAPGPGTRAGRLRPPVGDEVGVQGVTRVRHDERERSCSRAAMSRPPASRSFIGSQPSCAAVVAPRAGSIGPIRVGFGPTQRIAWSSEASVPASPKGTSRWHEEKHRSSGRRPVIRRPPDCHAERSTAA